MRWFTDDQLRLGVEAVILARELTGDRCLVCGEENHDANDAQPHAFVGPDLLEVLLTTAREERARAPGAGAAR
jgi:hypothetical protein